MQYKKKKPPHVETAALLREISNRSESKDCRLKNTGIEDTVIDEICSIAEKYQLERVILFGSRARGDFKRTSDIDLAISGGDAANFILSVDEETSTLLKYDVVNLDGTVQQELLDNIQKDGRILYEKI